MRTPRKTIDFLCFSVVMVFVSVVSCSSVMLAVDMDDVSKLSTAWCCTAQFVTMSRCAVAPASVVGYCEDVVYKHNGCRVGLEVV